VRVWVAQIDEAAVRNTRDVDILLRRSDWEPAKAALARTDHGGELRCDARWGGWHPS
jgi:hypothetical protein